MKITKYDICTDKICRDLKVACISDVHARKALNVANAVNEMRPDIILLAGDILEISVDYMKERNEYAMELLGKMSQIAPSYYCFGNHEIYYSHARRGQQRISDPQLQKDHIDRIKSLGIHIINDKTESFEDILIGGLVCGYDTDPNSTVRTPNVDFLREFDEKDGFKILLCHYPHYYNKFLKNTSFDLIVSGHAHGGQWRFFGRGVYSPHQGLFPKYTSGIYDNRFIISRGACNNQKPIPRFFNPCEVLEINIKKKM